MTGRTSSVILLALASAIAVVSTWWRIARDSGERDHDRRLAAVPPKHRRKPKARPGATTTARYHRRMQADEYIPLIPKTDVQQLEGLLEKIYAARGFRDGRAQLTAAWASALSMATVEAGGRWEPSFTVSAMDADRLQALGGVIDAALLGGQLAGIVAGVGAPPLRIIPLSSSPGPDDWFANFFPARNTVALKRSKWGEDRLPVSCQTPADYEGVHCTSRLEVLAHTLAHEMVHVLVFHALPDMDAASPAYLADDRHGPAFRLLNLRLFGHSREDFQLHRTPRLLR